MIDSSNPSHKLQDQQQFEREKACYEQNYQHFRAMNQIMWQIPLLAITLTGGLWYAASTQQGIAVFRTPALFLGATFNIALMIVLIRVRYVMGEHLLKLRQFYPPGFVEAAGDGPNASLLHKRKVVLYAFNAALGTAAMSCIIGSIYFAVLDWHLAR